MLYTRTAPRAKLVVASALFAMALGCLSMGQIRSAENGYFETVGLDRASVNYMDELSLRLVQRASRYLESRGLEYPSPILLRLRPPVNAGFEGDHQIQLGERSVVKLDLRWDDALTLERTSYLLSKALLLQYAVYNFGPGSAPAMRAWPVVALATDFYLTLRPAEASRMQRELGEEIALNADVLFRLRMADGEVPAASAYWLLRSLRVLSGDGTYARRFFKQAVLGIDVAEPLGILLRDSSRGVSPGTIEQWWATQKKSILGRPLERFDTMRESREWIESIADLGSIELEPDTEPLNLRSLRRHKDSAEVRESIEARYEILSLRLVRCNPAFHNAAQSLGALFEVFLEEEPSHKYVHALVIYLGDMEDARGIEAAINEKLAEEF